MVDNTVEKATHDTSSKRKFQYPIFSCVGVLQIQTVKVSARSSG